ncbi:hypothetical protein C7S13_1017 [Burkholderia cepacia]|nr:hypothetical protein [Burkholderia cepacia]
MDHEAEEGGGAGDGALKSASCSRVTHEVAARYTPASLGGSRCGRTARPRRCAHRGSRLYTALQRREPLGDRHQAWSGSRRFPGGSKRAPSQSPRCLLRGIADHERTRTCSRTTAVDPSRSV